MLYPVFSHYERTRKIRDNWEAFLVKSPGVDGEIYAVTTKNLQLCSHGLHRSHHRLHLEYIL